MPLGNACPFLPRLSRYDQSLEAMKQLAAEIERLTAATGSGTSHRHQLGAEPSYFSAAEAVSQRMKLAEPIPQTLHAGHGEPFRWCRP